MQILNKNILLRPTTEADLEVLFEFELDQESCF